MEIARQAADNLCHLHRKISRFQVNEIIHITQVDQNGVVYDQKTGRKPY